MFANPAVRMLIGAVVGAALGYALYRFVGCRGGACPLTGSPWITPVLWAILGALMARGGQ